MKLVFSEAGPDYSRYLYPYVVWGIPEPGETPADCLEKGFALSSPLLDRFVLCRHIRVNLRQFEPSSENRRILRKGDPIDTSLLNRTQFEITPERKSRWRAFADQRFGKDVMSEARLNRLLDAPVINHLLVFREQSNPREIGTALLYLENKRAAYYYYAFYELDQRHRNLGMFMMTQAVQHFADLGFEYLYLGTCYSEQALYKTQFPGTEFFNGNAWSTNLEELKYIVRHHPKSQSNHLLDDPAYLEQFKPS
jgi:arginyl-tRNA--protein-N-Asp/Glu arginylyltransferase